MKRASVLSSIFLGSTFIASGLFGCSAQIRLPQPLNSPAPTSFIGFQLDSSVPEDQSAALKTDLERLQSLSFSKAPSPLAQLMEIPALTPKSLNDWLLDRVKLIIGEDVDLDDRLVAADTHYAFQNPADFPTADLGVLTVMTNISSAVYLSGKTTQTLYTFKADQASDIQITSPRLGIIKIGAGLFEPSLLINPNDPSALSNTLSHLSTLFHEARHGDGHGKSLGFVHSLCPVGHDLAGRYACDASINGAYTLQKLILTEFLATSCSNCSEEEKSALRILIADQLTRILPNATFWDPAPEGTF